MLAKYGTNNFKVQSKCSQDTRSFRDKTGLRMTNTLRQPNRKNLRHPVTSYIYEG